MLQNFVIHHRPKPGLFSSEEYPIWSTCLRSLAFLPANSMATIAGDQVYRGVEAYEFLLEIICGLHSPIAGETEVFGQFKEFARRWIEAEPKRKPLLQRILSDAKAVRTAHLVQTGTQSYGGWLRQNLRGERIHILGGGHLAGEILPYLCKAAKNVSVHVREVARAGEFGVPVYALHERAFDGGALVIAAPMSRVEIEAWLAGRQPSEIFDLRETSNREPLPGARVLGEIFSELEQTKKLLQPRLESAKAEIRIRAQRALEQDLHRPLGWDDLCA